MSERGWGDPAACFEWCRDLLFRPDELPAEALRHEHELLAFCQRQQIGPLLHQRSQELAGSIFVPATVENEFEAASLDQWQRSNRLRFELNRIAGWFEQAGIDWVLLKGLGLADRYYGSTHARAFSDIDLLVRTVDLGTATDALVAAGYRRRSPRLEGDGALDRLQRRSLHHVELRRDDYSVEIHHNLRAHPAIHIEERELWEGLQPSRVARGGCRILSDENALFTALLALHADIELGVACFKNLADVDRILSVIDAETDWSDFLEHRNRDHTVSIAVNGIALTERLLLGRQRYPRASATLREPAVKSLILAAVDDSPAAEFLALFDSAHFEPRQARWALVRSKLWAHRQYRHGALRSIWNWAASLPIRLIGNTGRFGNLKQRRSSRARTRAPK